MEHWPNFIYLRFASLIWSLWVVTWLAAALWTRRSVARAPKSSFRREFGIAMLGFVCLFGEPLRFWHPLWPVSGWLGWMLVALVGLGTTFAWWARLYLGGLWSGGVETREGHRIVDTGPYRLVRHPIYTGIILGGFALAAIKATPLSVLGAVLLALGFGLKAKVEERFLAAQLGEADYAAYRARVPMLIPFLPSHG